MYMNIYHFSMRGKGVWLDQGFILFDTLMDFLTSLHNSLIFEVNIFVEEYV